MQNLCNLKLGILAVSRDCFLIDLSKRRRAKVVEECKKKGIDIIELQTIVENEKDAMKALDELKEKGVNALVIYLGNFGPEGPTTLLAQKFMAAGNALMFAAAAEETKNDLIDGRGDAYCGMLNASYSLNLRRIKPYIPEYPVGTADEVAEMIKDFVPIARVYNSVRKLKIFSFGPRPQDFLACNAPIKALFDIGVEVMENSELDYYDAFMSAKDDPMVDEIAKEMASELGKGNNYPDMLKQLAQLEASLMRFHENNKGASEFAVFANKCWPSFEKYFGCVPCYVNSRMASKGIPVACEVDIYGALSQYMCTAATASPATLLDINNSVPADMYSEAKSKIGDYKNTDLFMGFHCGNTPSSCLVDPSLKYQLIMKRLQEPNGDPKITRGTLEGRIKPGKATVFRFQSRADTRIACYLAEGDVLDIDHKSFGGIGVIAIKEMGRFYRHVLIQENFPHHSALAFDSVGKTLYAASRMLGADDIFFNLPKGTYYKTENPFG